MLAETIMAISAVVTALSALGAFNYVRRAFNDAAWSRRQLEGDEYTEGVIETVANNEHRSRQNQRALKSEGMLPDGGTITFGPNRGDGDE